MDNQQIPAADSKFQKIARKNHRKWKLRLLSKGGQKASSGGSPYKEKPDYNRAKSAPPGFGGSLEETDQLDEVIRKKDGKYCLFSKKTNKNLGCYPSKAGAMKRERQVQYFKHLKEEIIKVLEEILEEKDDRCTRIAKSKYDAWPSAYASGAVVKCRQGKIWKDLKEEEIPGGLSSRLSKNDRKMHQQIADKHNVPLEQITKQIRRGIKVELEHTDNHKMAHEIAADHLMEDPLYYSKLKKANIEEKLQEKDYKKERTKHKLRKGLATALSAMTGVLPPPNSMKGPKHKSHIEKSEQDLEERKLGKPSSETNLGDWFKRKGAPGKIGGWVDCNTCRDGKCKPCGRQEGEKRAKYPRCRPTPAQCKGYKRRGSNLQKEQQ